MIKRLTFMAAAVAMTACVWAQNKQMYLIKGDKVVGKYDTEAVDYISFELPDGVIDGSVYVDVEKAGKNSVTYSVGTVEPGALYGHGIVLKSCVNLVGYSLMGKTLEELTEAEFQEAVLYSFIYNYASAYVGEGSDSYTMTDFADDGNGDAFDVVAGEDYYAAAFPIDSEGMPTGEVRCAEFRTEDPGTFDGTFEVACVGQVSDGLKFSFEMSKDIVHIYTAFGPKSLMEQYAEQFGYSVLFVVAGNWSYDDIVNDPYDNTWFCNGSGEYIMYAIAVDAEGNQIRREVTGEYVAPGETGPKINFLDTFNGDGKVSATIEVTPSNVTEAYLRLMTENAFRDGLNEGMEPWELACTADAIDITADINANGEYTFTKDNLDEEWRAIVVYARDEEGNRTTAAGYFNASLPDAEWEIVNPVLPTAYRSLKKAAEMKRTGVGKHIDGRINFKR